MRSAFTLTPWVSRLLAANAIVYLLQITVFTGRWFFDLFAFVPANALSQPWTIATYMFVHGGFFHVAPNMLMLFFFGPGVERRLGGTSFAKYYFLCGASGAILSLAVVAIWPVSMIMGASGAVYGVMLAFALFWPDAQMYIFPLPMPIKVKWFVLFLIAVDVISAGTGIRDGVAHMAHLGGAIAGFGYLRWNNQLQPGPNAAVRKQPARVLPHPAARAVVSERERPSAPGQPQRRARHDELDRVLDKINESGIESLSPDEQHVLDEMSELLRGN